MRFILSCNTERDDIPECRGEKFFALPKNFSPSRKISQHIDRCSHPGATFLKFCSSKRNQEHPVLVRCSCVTQSVSLKPVGAWSDRVTTSHPTGLSYFSHTTLSIGGKNDDWGLGVTISKLTRDFAETLGTEIICRRMIGDNRRRGLLRIKLFTLIHRQTNAIAP